MPKEDFIAFTDQLTIRGTSYKLQIGLIRDLWTSRLIRGNEIIDSYVFEDVEGDFPNQNIIVGWVLKTVAIPNINPQQVMKITQKLVKQAIEKRERMKLKPSITNLSEIEVKEDSSLSNKIRILNLLKLESLTSKEIAERLDLDEQDTRTYLLRLKNENKIRVIDKMGRFYVYDYKTPDHNAEEIILKEVRKSVLMKDELIKTLQSSLKLKDKKITELQSEINYLNSRLHEFEKLVFPQDAKMQELSDRIPEKEQALESTVVDLHEAESEVGEFKSPKIGKQNFKSDIRISCPKCRAVGRDIKTIEDRSKVLSYGGAVPIYAKKHLCRKCGYEF